MGCGCGNKSKQTPKITPRSITTVVPSTRNVVQSRSVNKGVVSQRQKRCPKCSWPMNNVREFDTVAKTQKLNAVCMNRKCLHKENIG